MRLLVDHDFQERRPGELHELLEPGADIVKGFEPGMPSFRGVLSEAQVRSLVMYIEALGKKPQ